ncbi:MAG TPA: hypothetical protein VG826_35700 [Pirellulales bacterium]|nr:hypothetical protein [Pirellulales bacterium]
MPASHQFVVVEFVGGPYDGHKQVVECAARQPVARVVMPAVLGGLPDEKAAERLVLYALESSPFGWHYRHAGWAIAPSTRWRWLGAGGCLEWLRARIARHWVQLTA